MRSLILPARAKVNLHLAVLAKRPDGYHELRTLFERVDLADELHLARTAGREVRFSCDSRSVPSDGTNLAVRAAALYREASGWTDGIRIHLKKRIPVGGGLGGGSSDAAAVLGGLQRISGNALAPERLMECARSLGADVAFFTADAAWALGRDRGDRIEPLPLKARLWHLLVTPDFPIPTASVYSVLVPPIENSGITPLLKVLSDGQISKVRPLLYNALEPTVERLYPGILRVQSEMGSAGLEKPMVSGSGSTVFAVCDSEAQARSAGEALKKRNPLWRVNAASTI